MRAEPPPVEAIGGWPPDGASGASLREAGEGDGAIGGWPPLGASGASLRVSDEGAPAVDGTIGSPEDEEKKDPRLLVSIGAVETAAASMGRDRRAAREAGKKLAMVEPEAAEPDIAGAAAARSQGRRRRHTDRRRRGLGFGRKRVDLA